MTEINVPIINSAGQDIATKMPTLFVVICSIQEMPASLIITVCLVTVSIKYVVVVVVVVQLLANPQD